MTEQTEALKMALEALEEAHYKIEHRQDATKRGQAITAIKEALAQPIDSVEQEPDEWVLRITHDRRIEVNENVEVTKAAQTVLTVLQSMLVSQPEQWSTNDMAYRPGALVRTEPVPTPEQLAARGWQSIECPFCGTSGAQAFPKSECDWEGIAADQALTIALMKSEQHEQEPNGYVQTVIEALYENGDPVSVDAAELLQRITAQQEQEADAVAALTEEGWMWDGDQWQRPPQPEQEQPSDCKLRQALIDFALENAIKPNSIGDKLLFKSTAIMLSGMPITTPLKRQPLTDEQIDNLGRKEKDALLDFIYENGTASEGSDYFFKKYARSIEAAHGIKETT